MSRLDQRINKQERWAETNAAREAAAKRQQPEPLSEGEVGIADIYRDEDGLHVKLTDDKIISGNNLEFVHHEHFTRIKIGDTLYKDTRTAEAKGKFRTDEHLHLIKTEQAQLKLVTTPDEELDKDKQEEKQQLKRKFQAEADAKRTKAEQSQSNKSPRTAGATSAKQSVGGRPSPSPKSVEKPHKERPMRTTFDRVMNDEDGGGTATLERPKKSAKKKAAKKKAAPAKAVKKTAKKAASNGEAQYGVERDKDVRWSENKVAVFKALKACKATSVENAVPVARILEKITIDLDNNRVRHHCYHGAAKKDHKGNSRKPLVGIVESMEEGAGYGFYLTKEGASLDPAKELKAQEAGKDK